MLNNAGNKLCSITLVCVGLWFGLSDIPASAQNASTGAIFGALRDPAGAVIAGAIVKTMNLETAESRETATDQEGIYFVPLLQPGRYRLEISSPGFNLQKLEGINVRVADRVEINCTLTIENRAEIVNDIRDPNYEFSCLITAMSSPEHCCKSCSFAGSPVCYKLRP
jgi:hypothetical protein